MCNVTSWSRDGFGHQFMATVRCKEMAYFDESVRFVGSLKTHMEHADPNKGELLRLLTSLSGPERMVVEPRRYHGKDCHKCDPICDSCSPKQQSPAVRQSMARSLCAGVPIRHSARCSTGYDCFHLRQRQTWERSHWLKDRELHADFRLTNRTALITRGPVSLTNVFVVDSDIFTTISFVKECCDSFTPLNKSSFSDVLQMVHEHC